MGRFEEDAEVIDVSATDGSVKGTECGEDGVLLLSISFCAKRAFFDGRIVPTGAARFLLIVAAIVF